MRSRGAMVQGALALAGLAAAWATWQRDPDHLPGEVVVLDVTRNELSKVRYDDGKKWVELVPDKDEVWLHVGPRADTKTPERMVRGSDAARKLLDKFAPLMATRALGAIAGDKLKELGLDAPKKRIDVTARGATTRYSAGYSPFGVSSPYVKDEHDGQVYVLAGSVLSDLDGAPGFLVDRRLHAIVPSDWDALSVSAGGKKRELVSNGADSILLSRLAPLATPDKPDPMAKNWHDKLWGLVGVDVLGKDELPTAGDPARAVVLRVDYSFKGKPVGWVEIARVQPPAPPPPANTSAPPPPAPPVELYARSEFTAGWVKLAATAEDLVKEGEKVAAGQ